MIDLLDSHTHTLASGHAYSTMNEMIAAAKARGLKLIALTEHAPTMTGTCQWIYFANFGDIPRKRGDLWTMMGTELNILNRNGEVDLENELLKNLDVVIASIHPPCYHETDPKAHLEAYLNVMKNPWVNIIGHPDDGRYPVDYEVLVPAAKKYHKLLEVNSSSLSPNAYRENAKENYRKMLELCREYQTPVIVDSDAHIDCAVGDHTRAWKLLEEIDFPAELIVNTDLDHYFSYINFDPHNYDGIER